VVAISVDPPEVSRRLCQRLGLSFSILSDPRREVIRRYDLLHRHGGPKKADIARPAEFLIDSSGTVQWVNLTESIAVRATPEEVLKAFDEIHGTAR
jgi:peroxiredoxin